MGIEECKQGIIVIYINVENLSRQRADELISEFVKMFNIDGFCPIFIPSNISKVEIIWRGYEIEQNYSLNNKKINHLVSVLESCINIEDVRKMIRLIKIDSLKK